MSFIVTGGLGFIGSALCGYLCKTYPNTKIINVSKQTYATSPKLTRFLEVYENYTFVPMDFCDTIHFHQLLKQYHVTRVYHLGATSLKVDFVEPPIYGSVRDRRKCLWYTVV